MSSPGAIVRDRVRRLLQPIVLRRLLRDRFAATSFVWRDPTEQTVDVLLCLWNRPELLRPMLERLDAQEDVSGGIRLRIWNNQRRDSDRYRAVLGAFHPSGSLVAADLVTSPFNLGAMARFYWARRIAR